MIEARRKPIEERIAALMGKSSFIDLRDGIGGTNPLRIKDADVAAALGAVARTQGSLAAMVLETYYGSTLLHLRSLIRVWDQKERQPKQGKSVISLTRVAGQLAVRDMAGNSLGREEMEHYAYLMACRRDDLLRRKADAYAWLDSIRSEALHELREQLQEPTLADN